MTSICKTSHNVAYKVNWRRGFLELFAHWFQISTVLLFWANGSDNGDLLTDEDLIRSPFSPNCDPAGVELKEELDGPSSTWLSGVGSEVSSATVAELMSKSIISVAEKSNKHNLDFYLQSWVIWTAWVTTQTFNCISAVRDPASLVDSVNDWRDVLPQPRGVLGQL